MAKDREQRDQIKTDATTAVDKPSEFSLEDILAEFGSGHAETGRSGEQGDSGRPDLPLPEADHHPVPGNIVPFPRSETDELNGAEPLPNSDEPDDDGPPPDGDEPDDDGPPPDGDEPDDDGPPPDGDEPDDDGPPSDGDEPDDDGPPSDGNEPGDDGPPPDGDEPDSGDKILPFSEYTPEQSPLQDALDRLRKKADDYAEQMFTEEGKEHKPRTMRLERLIPGVDEEEKAPPKPKKVRRKTSPPPDLSPSELTARYAKGLGLLRLRSVLVLLLALPLLYLAVAELSPLFLPGILANSFSTQVLCSAVLLGAAMLLGVDVLLRGVWDLFLLRPGVHTLCSFACAATLADALTQFRLTPERHVLPLCCVCVLSIFFALRGEYIGRQGLRLSCRTAASAAEPYLVTLDENCWNGRDTYAKWSGLIHGFGSQIQEDDLSRKVWKRAAPLLLLACFLLSLVASVGHRTPEHMLWCLSAMLTACTSFSGFLTFALPFRTLTRRLAASGASLPGWSAAEKAGGALLVNDTDLFPPGSVSMNGIKVFGDFPVEKVVGVTATLIRDSGSGLDQLFHDLLRTQGAVYRRAADVTRHEGGGLSGVIRGEQILVGSAAFLSLMAVPLPPGLKVHNAVFCAIDNQLAGVFALNYTMNLPIPPALSALISASVSPVLATRDFNLIPAMLRQKFKLPVDKMAFPATDRRAELSDPNRPHSGRIVAVLCREGLVPFAEAIIGARRLRGAVRLSTGLSVLGALVGLLLSFYLSFISAWISLAAIHLAFFQLAWLVPVWLISGWVNRY
jgi:hypothetical protein